MDLRRLEVFAKVAELGSFSRAAEALYLTQPTVSEHVRALEDERSEEHTSELQSQSNIVCRLPLEKKHAEEGALGIHPAQLLGHLRGGRGRSRAANPGARRGPHPHGERLSALRLGVSAHRHEHPGTQGSQRSPEGQDPGRKCGPPASSLAFSSRHRRSAWSPRPAWRPWLRTQAQTAPS